MQESNCQYRKIINKNEKQSTMKKVLMALTMVALAHISAEAQSKNENFKVCKNSRGYATCGREKTATAEAKNQQNEDWTQATAKTSKSKTQNYKVCKYANGYATSGKEKAITKVPANMPPVADQAVNVKAADNDVVESTVTTTAPVSYTYYDRMVSYFDRPKHHVIIYSDSMNAPYKGQDSRQNDGVAKNEYRNLNYQLATATLPPSSGSFTK